MTTFLLIRHGMTDAVGRRIVGWLPGVSLNDEGRRQAERLGQALRVDAVYSSPLERAMETAQAMGLPVIARDELGEIRFGEWTGQTLEELERDERWRRWNTERGALRAPGGESMAEVRDRMIGELRRLQKEHPRQTVAVVSHGDPIRAAIVGLLDAPMDAVLRLQIHPASVSVVRKDEGWWEIDGVNRTIG